MRFFYCKVASKMVMKEGNISTTIVQTIDFKATNYCIRRRYGKFIGKK